ncbi:TetR/AcrR family transcriptional regulator [Dactylosporangium sp. NPDC051541]|uniref:TetR/AcrR family transcriptional regulator n=1 Tax=Dactylosporangium sp. NPDC051541 TaxID=3363977 RepID=UPI00379BDD1A
MGLREEKKRQTRAALIAAAATLFAERGYEATTVADIAAGANVSTRTFFSYFRAKEDVLFAGTDERLAALAAAFADVSAATPLEALRRIAAQVMSASSDLPGPDRLAILLARPELQAQAMLRLLAAQRLIGEWLLRAYPSRLDATLARAVAGALVGALVGTVLGSIESGTAPDLDRTLRLLEDGLGTLG